MNQNLLGLTVYDLSPIQIITKAICGVLKKHYHEISQNEECTIEIQYKYAQFRAFCNSEYMKPILQLPNKQISPEMKDNMLRIAEHYVIEQSKMHFQSIKALSYQSMILMNNLERRVYQLAGGFDENKHKKFYVMREFLYRLCLQNQKNHTIKQNYYSEIRNQFKNKTFRLINQSEFRLDINVKGGQNEGRYSYLLGKGWTRTRKMPLLLQQFDIMIHEKTYRLAGQRQQQIKIQVSDLQNVLNSQQAAKSKYLRFKRALKVQKDGHVQYSLSEIYEPQQQKREELFSDIKDLISMPSQNLDQFIVSAFQRFYMPCDSKVPQKKYQIECQFTRVGLKHLNDLREAGKYLQIERQLEINLGDMHALFYTEHNIKMKESKILDQLSQQQQNGLDYSKVQQKKFPPSRLENQFGGYMHSVIKQYMQL